MLSSGQKQEDLLFKYLRFNRHCAEVVETDQGVRQFLGMQGTFKCADALGLHQHSSFAGPKRFTVAESKGTDINSAIEQLGNAAAGVFDKFGRESRVDLLVLVPALVERPTGSLSPGPGYRAAPLATGLNKFTLEESMGGPPLQAKPKVTYPEWMKWAGMVLSLRIVVLLLRSESIDQGQRKA